MKKFVPLLRKINEKLDLPQPIKSRIILEIAADLNDLYEVYRSKGLSEDEAFIKAEEKFDASDETIRELIKLHTTGIRKFLDKISQRAQVTWEKIILVVMIFSIAIYSNRRKIVFELYLILTVLLIAILSFGNGKQMQKEMNTRSKFL